MRVQESLLAKISVEEYVQLHLNGDVHVVGPKELGLRMLMAIFGLTWGVPWTKAASGAAAIFHEGPLREAFEKIFAMGIVITVGADGLWLMLEAGKSFGSRSREEQRLLPGSTRGYKYTKLGVSSALSLLTCIPSVYASVTYNKNSAKYLSILTFLGNYGQGLFGYGVLFDRFAGYLNNQGQPQGGTRAKLIQSKAEILENINNIIAGNVVFSRGTLLDQILMQQPLSDLPLSPASPAFSGFAHSSRPSIQMAIQLIFTLFILASVTSVDLFLTKNFLKKDIKNNPEIDYSLAVFCEIPGFVTTAISVFSTLGRVFDTLACKPQDPEMKLASDMYPKMMFFMGIFTFILALLAPTAAAYITYETFGGEKNMSQELQVAATVSMTLARLIFSNFTLSHLTKNAALAFYNLNYEGEPDNPLLIRYCLIPLKRTLEKAKLECFEVE